MRGGPSSHSSHDRLPFSSLLFSFFLPSHNRGGHKASSSTRVAPLGSFSSFPPLIFFFFPSFFPCPRSLVEGKGKICEERQPLHRPFPPSVGIFFSSFPFFFSSHSGYVSSIQSSTRKTAHETDRSCVTPASLSFPFPSFSPPFFLFLPPPRQTGKQQQTNTVGNRLVVFFSFF